jgi:hypothetical protein
VSYLIRVFVLLYYILLYIYIIYIYIYIYICNNQLSLVKVFAPKPHFSSLTCLAIWGRKFYSFPLLRYLSDERISANFAHVGLAPPGDVGSWQTECKVFFFFFLPYSNKSNFGL